MHSRWWINASFFHSLFPFLHHVNWERNLSLGFPSGSDGKESPCNPGDPGSIPGLGRSPGKRHGNPLQYSCLENLMDRGAWGATIHGVRKRMRVRGCLDVSEIENSQGTDSSLSLSDSETCWLSPSSGLVQSDSCQGPSSRNMAFSHHNERNGGGNRKGAGFSLTPPCRGQKRRRERCRWRLEHGERAAWTRLGPLAVTGGGALGSITGQTSTYPLFSPQALYQSPHH